MFFVVILLSFGALSFVLVKDALDHAAKRSSAKPSAVETADEPGPEVQTLPSEQTPEEGQCAIPHQKEAAKQCGQEPDKPSKKLDIDRRKLVIYSEIMHPKFDE